jgi:hypothetical protein
MFDRKFITQAIDRSAQSPLDRRRFFSAAGVAGLGVGAAALIPATGAQAADAQAEADAGAVTDAAVLNFALNLVAIPLAGATGAAITTAVAEACVFLSAAWYSRQSIDLKELCSRLSPALVTLALGIDAVLLVSIPLAHLPLPWIAGFFVRGLCFVTVYAIVLLLKRDPLLLMALGAVRARIGHDDKD